MVLNRCGFLLLPCGVSCKFAGGKLVRRKERKATRRLYFNEFYLEMKPDDVIRSESELCFILQPERRVWLSMRPVVMWSSFAVSIGFLIFFFLTKPVENVLLKDHGFYIIMKLSLWCILDFCIVEQVISLRLTCDR